MRKPTSRSEVYAAINGERDYQDQQQGNAKRHEDEPLEMTVGEHILYMEKCLNDAREACYSPTGIMSALGSIRKVAALAVRCMEQHGAPRR